MFEDWIFASVQMWYWMSFSFFFLEQKVQFHFVSLFIPYYNIPLHISDRCPVSIYCTCCCMGKTCHSLSNSPHNSLSDCCQLITNRNKNHKHIIQTKDRLPKHFALPSIILKVQAQSGISRSYGETKTIKPKRCAAADKHNRQTEAKRLRVPRGIY